MGIMEGIMGMIWNDLGIGDVDMDCNGIIMGN